MLYCILYKQETGASTPFADHNERTRRFACKGEQLREVTFISEKKTIIYA